MPGPRFVLASSSPRRHQLLAQLGVAFTTVSPDVDESQLPHESPAAMVGRVARLKATVVDAGDLPVLAADTTVVLDGDVLGKPADPEHARTMLRRLSGRTHTVATGVAVRKGSAMDSIVVTSEVSIAAMTGDEIAWYVATGEPLDKAGAYGLNGLGGVFVRRVLGSHSAVIGLPLAESVALLRAAGVDLAGSGGVRDRGSASR